MTNHLAKLDEGAWQGLLDRLRAAGLVAKRSSHAPGEVDAHPLVLEHFGAELRRQNQEAWRAGHGRLYEYFKGVPTKHQPDTLKDLAPLFQAVFHGCQAGRHQEALDEVYWRRISRGDQFYETKTLGAFGASLAALAGFFDPPWVKPVPSIRARDQAFVLSEAGFRLRALGRLGDAVPRMRASLEMAIATNDWKNAAIRAGNLSEMKLRLGELIEAVALAKDSVEYADRSGYWDQQMSMRTTLADALHQAGERARAGELFQEAEQLLVKHLRYPRLFSVWGDKYCDLLLGLDRCVEVRERAAGTLASWAERRKGLLDIALDHLSLGRAELLGYGADGNGDFAEAESQLNQAVEGLRMAGGQEFVPRGLLARAAYFRVAGKFGRARRDLDEVMRIATRSGMRLHECDAHLELARLSIAEGKPDAARNHLARAVELVEETGYHRRDEEVQKLQEQLGEPG